MSTWDFRPGQRVVCINDEGYMEAHERVWFFFSRMRRFEHNLVRNQIYTITATTVVPAVPEWVGCWVRGACWLDDPDGTPFPARWFRPLQKRKTSIEVFEKILNGAPVEGDFAPTAGSDTFPPRAHEVHVPRRTNPS